MEAACTPTSQVQLLIFSEPMKTVKLVVSSRKRRCAHVAQWEGEFSGSLPKPISRVLI